MPASLVGRTETRHVTLRSQNDAETFALGLKSFVNEARMLARFDHPSLLKVHRFWLDVKSLNTRALALYAAFCQGQPDPLPPLAVLPK